MADQQFYKDLSDVTVTFKNGELKVYRISAGPSIGGYLAREARGNGVLSLWNGRQSYAIPLDNIREWVIEAVPVPPEGQTNG